MALLAIRSVRRRGSDVHRNGRGDRQAKQIKLLTVNCRAVWDSERERMDMTLTAEKNAKLSPLAAVGYTI